MAQYSACPVETPRLPEWARQLKRRTWRSKEDLSKISAQAKEELPRLALIPKVWCALVSLVLLSFLFVVALQYAGMVEIQYELNRRENELARLNQGTSTYPDRSATAIVANVHFAGPDHQTALTATGPGIRTSQPVPMPLTDGFLVQWQANHARFPQGVDCFFCGEGLVSGLPRTTVLHGQA